MPSLARLRRRHAIISAQLDELQALSHDDARLARHRPQVSGWTVGQHVEHLAHAHGGVIMRLAGMADGTIEERGTTPLRGRLVLAWGLIPRGRAQAPAPTVPRSLPSDELRRRFAQMRDRFARLEPQLDALRRSPATFAHPIFGPWRGHHWLRFLEIHHRHHAKIWRDIEAG